MSSARSAKKKPAPRKSTAKPVSAAKKPARKASSAPKVSAKKPAPGGARTTTRRSVSSVSDDPIVGMCRDLAALVEAHALSELIVDTPDATLTFRRGGEVGLAGAAPMQVVHAPPMQHAPAPALPAAPAPAAPAAPVDDGAHVVTSPFVGTFYRSPNPDSPAYCDVGQRVEKGQVLCIVEAMKLMNEIEADQAGTISAILVDNAEVVEYGQALFKIAPA